MSFPRYERYKDSGVEWLGKVPEHWELYRSRRLFTQRQERARETDQQLTASQKHGIVSQAAFMEAEGRAVVRVIHGAEILKHVEPNDFVISMRSFQGGLEWSAMTGCISSAYVMLMPVPRVHPPYFRHLFKSDIYIQALQTTSNLVRDGQAMRYENFTLIDLPLPPTEEQKVIALFLDAETAKIDALIEEQRRLIELLKEKRQAVISHAVTKGLDLDAPMKDSGIEWLGEVPAGWRVVRLRMMAEVRGGIAKGRDLSEAESITVPYLRVANVQDGYLDLTEVTTIDIEPHELERYRLLRGDVLMNEGGDFDKLGRGCIWRGEIEDCIHQNHVFSVRPSNIEPEWLTLITTADCGRFYFMTRSKQSTNLASISSSNLRELPVPLPPETERKAILTGVDSVVVHVGALVQYATSAIELLQERRSALISAAVTGKIDVRNYIPKEAA